MEYSLLDRLGKGRLAIGKMQPESGKEPTLRLSPGDKACSVNFFVSEE